MKINWKYILIIALVIIVPSGTIWAAGYYAKKKLIDAKAPIKAPSTIAENNDLEDIQDNENNEDGQET